MTTVTYSEYCSEFPDSARAGPELMQLTDVTVDACCLKCMQYRTDSADEMWCEGLEYDAATSSCTLRSAWEGALEDAPGTTTYGCDGASMKTVVDDLAWQRDKARDDTAAMEDTVAMLTSALFLDEQEFCEDLGTPTPECYA